MRKVIILLLFFTTSVCFAQESWQIAPMSFDFHVSPGDSINQSFSLLNQADSTMKYRVFLSDLVVEDDQIEITDVGETERSCMEWIFLSPENFSVTPMQSQNVRFTLAIPDSNLSGTYYGVIVVEPDEEPQIGFQTQNEQSSYTIYMNIRSYIWFYVTIDQNSENNGEIANVTAEYNSMNDSLKVKSVFKNIGNTRLKCNSYVDIRNELGETVKTIENKNFNCLPNKYKTIKFDNIIDLDKGDYSALVVVDFLGDFLVAGEAFFNVP